MSFHYCFCFACNIRGTSQLLFSFPFFFSLLFHTCRRNNAGENIYTRYKTRKPLVFGRWRRLRYLFISGFLIPLVRVTKTFVCSLNKLYVTGPREMKNTIWQREKKKKGKGKKKSPVATEFIFCVCDVR